MGYQAILFAPGGDYVTDYHCDTVKEVIEQLENKGSRWLFYPFEAVILDKLPSSRRRLVDVAPPLEEFKGKAVSTVQRYLEQSIIEIP